MNRDTEADLIEVMASFREACEPRVSHKTYLELFMITYHKAVMNVLIEAGVLDSEKLYNSLKKYFGETTEKVKQNPMLSPFQK